MIERDAAPRFRILRQIGAGGMGIVYEALDEERQTRVALKTLSRLDPDTLLLFKREFRAAQDIQHPNLISLGELFERGGQWFFTMELIDGVDFKRYVRGGPPPAASQQPKTSRMDDPWSTEDTVPSDAAADEPRGYDEARLRHGLKQLAEGIAALHRAGRVHRDIKPSNVLIGRDDRVVLIDFGLVSNVTDERKRGLSIAGTPEYMAPEQAAGGRVDAQADWYSFGVLLYEALTSSPPFIGPPIQVLLRKQSSDPLPPHALVPDVPKDLDALCVELLQRDPAVRPRAAQILERLSGTPSVGRRATLDHTRTFVGRVDELDALERSLGRCRRGHAEAVFIHGESGIGKSALVREFVASINRGQVDDPVVLAGRCYERESVPYKAFDDLIDQLSDHLSRIPPAEASELLPARIGLLAQVFPVLSRCQSVVVASRARTPSGDGRETRARVFGALRELFERLCQRRPVVLVIDDVQWADADSLALLSDLVRPPSPRLLVIATVRSMPGLDPAANEMLARLPFDLENVRHLGLDPLPPDEASTLARHLVGPEHAGADQIAKESNGHPLFIEQLARDVVEHAVAPDRRDSLEAVVWSRIVKLDAADRALLTVVAAADTPLKIAVVAQAAALEPAELERRVASLLAARLVRTSGAPGAEIIEPYHDRARQALLSQLAPDERRRVHERLALVLEQSGAAPEHIAAHWMLAQGAERAAHYFALAGARADQALAFEHAVHVYQLAVDLGPSDHPARGGWLLGLARALRNTGRSADAARAYLAAALGASEPSSIDEVQRLAADQLLRIGLVDEGLRAIAPVLEHNHLALPPEGWRAWVSLLASRAAVRLRGTHFRSRAASQLEPSELARIDTCWSLAAGLSLVDVIRGAHFQARCLRLALKAGEPMRVARSLALEAGHSALGGSASQARTAALVKSAYEIASRLEDPLLLGWVTLAQGIVATLEGRWGVGFERCRRAEARLRRCAGATWEIANAQLFAAGPLFYLGRLDELARLVNRGLEHAQERGDVYAETSLIARARHLDLLRGGDARAATQELDRAMQQWSSRKRFMLPHYYELFARSHIALLDGRAEDALAGLDAHWSALERLQLLRAQFIRIETLHLRARCALAAARTSPEPKPLLARASRDARRIAGEGAPWGRTLALLLQAGVARAHGDEASAAELLSRAIAVGDQCGMALYAAAARRRLGVLRGGDEGRELVREADAPSSPGRAQVSASMATFLVPGFGD